MVVFFVLLLIPICAQHIALKQYNVDNKKKNETALVLFFLMLTVLVMLRHKSVGSDTINYANIFLRISSMSWLDAVRSSMESGFMWFNKIVSFVSKDPQVFFAVVAIALTAMIYPTYKRLCVDASLTIVLYVTMSTFIMMFSGIRQMLAVGIGLIAYEFTRKKKIVPFILMVVLAMSFHISAFMLVLMYPLYHAKITKKWLFAVIPALAVMFVFNERVFLILAVILERFTDYEGVVTQTGAYTMIILFAAFAVFAFMIPDESKIDSETVGLRNFLLLSIAIQMFAPLNYIAMRMNYYYIIFIPLLIPKIIEARSERWKQVAVVGRNVMVVFFLAYFFYNAYVATNNLHVFPYHFFWETV